MDRPEETDTKLFRRLRRMTPERIRVEVHALLPELRDRMQFEFDAACITCPETLAISATVAVIKARSRLSTLPPEPAPPTLRTGELFSSAAERREGGQ